MSPSRPCCDFFLTEGIIDQRSSKFVVFRLEFKLPLLLFLLFPSPFNTTISWKNWNTDAQNAWENRKFEISGAQGSPATLHGTMWKNWWKNVDLDDPTSFPDHVYLECTQRECKPKSLRNIQKCLNHTFLLGQLKSYPGWEKPRAKTLHGPTTWKDTLEHAWRDVANCQTKIQNNYTKSQILAQLHVGKHGSELSMEFIPRPRLCWRLWGFIINLGESLTCLWNPNICPPSAGCARNSIPQFYRIWDHFLWMLDCEWMSTSRTW